MSGRGESRGVGASQGVGGQAIPLEDAESQQQQQEQQLPHEQDFQQQQQQEPPAAEPTPPKNQDDFDPAALAGRSGRRARTLAIQQSGSRNATIVCAETHVFDSAAPLLTDFLKSATEDQYCFVSSRHQPEVAKFFVG